MCNFSVHAGFIQLMCGFPITFCHKIVPTRQSMHCATIDIDDLLPIIKAKVHTGKLRHRWIFETTSIFWMHITLLAIRYTEEACSLMPLFNL